MISTTNTIIINNVKFFRNIEGSYSRNVDGIKIEILGFNGGKRYIVAMEGCKDAIVMTHADMCELLS